MRVTLEGDGLGEPFLTNTLDSVKIEIDYDAPRLKAWEESVSMAGTTYCGAVTVRPDTYRRASECERDFRHNWRAMGSGSMLTAAHQEASSP